MENRADKIRYLDAVTDDINNLLKIRTKTIEEINSMPKGYFDRAREILKNANIDGSARVIDVDEPECVGIEIKFQKNLMRTRWHYFHKNRETFDIKAIYFSDNVLKLSIHFND